MQFSKLLEKIVASKNLSLKKIGESYIVDLPAISGFQAKLDIGPEALDWYLSISHRDLKEPYFDWMDYIGYDSTPETELLKQKLKDIKWFLDQWMETKELKISSYSHIFGLFKKQKIYWRQDDNWTTIEICALSK